MEVLAEVTPAHRCATAFVRLRPYPIETEGTDALGILPPPQAPLPAAIVEHARLHCNKRVVYALDLVDFFPSITWPRVYGLLRKPPFEASEDVARLLANLTCAAPDGGIAAVQAAQEGEEVTAAIGALPQGAPTSPLLSNLVCWRLDQRLLTWARRHRCTYSRYADDLAFSSTHRGLPARAVEELHAIIREEGFQVHTEKSRTMPYYERQIVTGLIVNGPAPRVPREYVRALRALLHNVALHGWSSQLDRLAAFESMEHYGAFRARALPWPERRRILKEQRRRNLLLDPSAPIRGLPSRFPTNLRVRRFQLIIRGRIDYVGQVHGRESAVYRGLRAAFEHARRLHPVVGAERLTLSSPLPVRLTPPAPVRALAMSNLESTDLGYPSREAADAARLQREAAFQWANEIQAAVTPEAQAQLVAPLLAWLRDHAAAAPEYRDVLDRLEKHPETPAELRATAELLKDVARAASAHPLVTATFFKGFYRDTEFKNLLHDAIPTAPPDQAYEASLDRYRRFEPHLPPSAKPVLLTLLDEAGDALNDNPAVHPYSNPRFREKLFAIKQALRVDFLKSPSKPDSTHLPHWMDAQARVLAEEFGRSYAGLVAHRKPQRLYVPVQPLQAGLTEILRSMFENTKDGATVRIEYGSKQEGVNQRVFIRIADDDPTCEQPPELAHLTKGKLERALRALLGIAEWSLAARFDGVPARFDFTQNSVLPSPEPLFGVTHELVLHHLEG